jgi:hypothetical protein
LDFGFWRFVFSIENISNFGYRGISNLDSPLVVRCDRLPLIYVLSLHNRFSSPAMKLGIHVCLVYYHVLLLGMVCLQATGWNIVSHGQHQHNNFNSHFRQSQQQYASQPSHCRTRTTLSSSMNFDDSLFSTAPVVVAFALILGVAAQTFINTMLKGDRGLGAFLRDGRGYNGSGFLPGERRADNDPLPWLSLPKLDFVEVAGQESQKQKLERLRQDMTIKLEQGEVEEATIVRQELEALMEENGFEFKADGR